MANKLRNLWVKKVDLVDAGANQHADVLLYKSREGNAKMVEDKKHIFQNLVSAIGKVLGYDNIKSVDEVNKEDIAKKDAQTFHEKMYEAGQQRISEEIWEVCYALQSALISIISDEDVEGDRKALMEESLTDFAEVMRTSIARWSDGEAADIEKCAPPETKEEIKYFKSVHDSLEEMLSVSGDENIVKDVQKQQEVANKEGDLKEMRVDKSKMTPAEKAFFEDIEKRYGVENGAGEGTKADNPVADAGTDAGNPVDKSKNPTTDIGKDESGTGVEKRKDTESSDGKEDDIYKGLHPAVAAELQYLRKRAEEAEDRELQEVAKKYEAIGKKPEELVPLLKSLKTSDEESYNSMIAIMDASVEAVEKSGVFSEIGKSGAGGYSSVAKSAPESKIETIAKGYMEKDPSMSYTEAVAKAWENNPDLMADYEEEAGF